MFIRKTLYPLITACLLAGYGYVAYLALHPDIDERYRAYYIDKSTTISPTEYERFTHYKAGTKVDHTGESKILFEHWNDAEESHRWSSGNQSQLLFYVEDRNAYTGKILLNCFYNGSQNITVSINGKTVANFIGTGDDPSRTIPFDPKILKENSVNTITFSFVNPNSPELNDTRTLALALREITIF